MKSRVVIMALLCLLLIFTGAYAETAPVVEDLVYTGAAQPLVKTAGIPNEGYKYYYRIQASPENLWSAELPEATDAGDYVLEYAYTDKEVTDSSITVHNRRNVKISPMPLTVNITPPSEAKEYNGKEQVFLSKIMINTTVDFYTADKIKYKGTALVRGEDVPVTAGPNADTYTIYPRDFENTDSNFDVTFNISPNTVTIRPKELTLKWSPDDSTVQSEGTDTIDMTFNGKQERQPNVEVGEEFIETDAETCALSLSGDKLFKVGDGVGKATAAFSNTTCAGNYTFKNDEQQFRIIPATVELTWGETTFTYDGEPHIPTATYQNFSGGTYDATVTEEKTDAGTYTATASTGNSNYVIDDDSSSKEFKINPAAVTVTIAGLSAEVTYDGEDHTVGYEVKSIQINGEDTDLYTEDDFGPVAGKKVELTEKDAETYSLDLSGRFENKAVDEEGHSNFDVTFKYDSKCRLTIKKADVTLTWEGDEDGKTEVIELPFNGKKQSPKVSEAEGIVDTDAETCVITVGGGTKFKVSDGTGTATASFSDESCSSNYNITNQEHAFKIVPAEVDLTWTDTSLVYNGEAQKPKATYENFSGGTNDATVSGEQTNVGTYTAEATDSGNKNYSISEATKTKQFSIVGSEVNVTWDEKTEFIYDGSDQRPKIASITDIEGNNLPASLITVSVYQGETKVETYKDAGSYTAKVELTDPDNYTFGSSTQEEQPFVIVPKEVALEWSKTSLVYNTKEQAPTVTVSSDSLISGDECEVIEIDGKQTNAGTGYTATATKLSNENYALPEEASTDYVITPKKVVLTWENTVLVYNGEDQAPTAWYTDLEDNKKEDVTVTVTEDPHSAVGDYNATAAITDTNYTPNEATKSITFKITGLKVKAEWSSLELEYNGKNQHPLITKLTNADDETEEVEAEITYVVIKKQQETDTYKNVNQYRVEAKLTDRNISFASPGNSRPLYNIIQKEVTLEWTDTKLTYNGKYQHPTATASGIVDGDTCTLKYEHGNTNVVKDKTASASFEEDICNTNYKISNPEQTFTISPLSVTLTWDKTEFDYTGEDQAPKATYTDVNGDEQSAVVSVKDPYAEDHKNAGEYTAVASITDTNYEITNPEQAFTIGVTGIKITWSTPTEFTYNGQNQRPTVTKITDADGKDIDVSMTVTVQKDGAVVTSYADAGSYTAVAAFNDAKNYKFLDESQTTLAFSINPMKVKFVWADETEFVYNGQNQRAKIYNFTDEDGAAIATTPYTIKVEGVDEDGNYKNAGNYTAVIEITDSNYTFFDESQATKPFEIVPAPVTLKWNSSESFLYTGKVHGPTEESVTINGLVADEEQAKVAKITVTGSPMIDAGSYTAVAEVSFDPANYELAKEPKTDEFTYTIKQATLTVDPQPVLKPGPLSYTGDHQALLASLGVLKANNNVDPVEGGIVYVIDGQWKTNPDENPTAKEVGTYTVSYYVSGYNDKNYICADDEAHPVTLGDVTIRPATATITVADGQSFTYTGENLRPDITVTYENGTSDTYTYGNDPQKLKITITPTGTGTYPNVGTYSMKVESNDPNMNAEPVTVGFQITKVNYVDSSSTGDVTEPNSFAVLPIDGLTYNGAYQTLVNVVWSENTNGTVYFAVIDESGEQIIEKAVTDLNPGDFLEAAVAKNVGTYDVYYYVKGDENHNDFMAEAPFAGPVQGTITEADLANADITLNPAVLPYTGDPVTANPTVTYNGIPLVLGEHYEITGNVATEVGTYTLTITAVDGSNFIGSNSLVWEIKDMVNRINMFRIGEPDKVCLRCGVLGGELPATGFPTRVNVPLSVKPQGLDYAELGMRIQIPSLNVDVELAGVPTMDGAWKVEWLADRAGLLSGTALPGDGYSIVAAHNTLNAEEVGPFVLLSTLQDNDTIFVNAPDGSMKLFRVYANELLAPNDMETLASIAEQESNTLVLVTCENESVDGGYLNRRVVFAKPLN